MISIRMKDAFSTPNLITYSRILFIPVFVVFLLIDIPYRNYIAAIIFIILSLSDALDGYIARKTRQITGIGKIIDPIADKLLISAALIFLIGRIQLWMAVVIIVREIAITVLRLFFLPKKVIISASYLGKIKTIIQIIAILAVILNVPFNWWLMLIAVIITVISGFDYLLKVGKLAGENIINIPNIITTFRLLLIPLYIINLIQSNINLALVLFAVVILLDKVDGISARITKQITKFGRLYDAFTDSILIISSYIAFYLIGFLEFFWILLFIVPTLAIIISKITYYMKLREVPSSALGKTIVGIAYVAVIAVAIDFIYSLHILIFGTIFLYIYGIMDVHKSQKIKKIKNHH
ncbi:CDP-diacylglycerol--glycerol-3-phosphate 3-phosphatidyltransferase [archaeon]|nr:CDP-diacylglycerol--glycerol-3-phosphate 3-phosphatidyltransferase [archaeon]